MFRRGDRYVQLHSLGSETLSSKEGHIGAQCVLGKGKWRYVRHHTWCRSPNNALWLPSTCMSYGLTVLNPPGSSVEQLASCRRGPVHCAVEEESEEVWRDWMLPC